MASDVILLSKILPFFIMPLGVTTALVLAGIYFQRHLLCLAGLLVLWVAAMPVTSKPFIRMIEGNAVRMAAEDMPKADAIVVLSGGRVTAPGDPPVSEWSDGDRFFGGIELFRAGKAPLLIFTDGWSPLRPDMPSQGGALKQHALDMGVSPDSLRVTDKVVNTAAEAEAVAQMLPKSARALLVTKKAGVRPAFLTLLEDKVHYFFHLSRKKIIKFNFFYFVFFFIALP